ncbi:alginate O-acetyltransferase AlgX-related protein [Algoriphagus mannitolivorans]|uniref:alginate O-acetyltransferase AlgX-related protein n=1 Tax=Algoriphagus mannitolivorans TaxID=226504 RepID=UPI000401CB0A|nr:hypothetical protein [Algoriphagus mannitolivorans]
MEKFIIRFSFFISPIILAFILTEAFFSTDKGDLLKIGYIADISGYDKSEVFKEEFEREKFFTSFSELSIQQNHRFKTFVIGDSFSDQGNYSFTNYLAEYSRDSLLYLDRNFHDNPIQTLSELANGDFFDSLQVEFVVLQSVERSIPLRIDFDQTLTLTLDSLWKIKESRKSLVGYNSNEVDKLFSDRILKFTTLNLGYLVDDNAFYSETYIVETRDFLFSVKNKDLLFFFDDLRSITDNSEKERLEKLNDQINLINSKLSEKGIKLIVLFSPDKYGFYYDQIVDKEKYPQPLFFKIFESLPKNYLYLNSDEILKKSIPHQKDLYFYDDTHWSPIAAKLIAKEIDNLMEKQGTL